MASDELKAQASKAVTLQLRVVVAIALVALLIGVVIGARGCRSTAAPTAVEDSRP